MRRPATDAISSYVLLDDEIVGDHNAALPGTNPYWLPNTIGIFSPHLSAMGDDRILADIGHRLRGEPPFTILLRLGRYRKPSERPRAGWRVRPTNIEWGNAKPHGLLIIRANNRRIGIVNEQVGFPSQ